MRNASYFLAAAVPAIALAGAAAANETVTYSYDALGRLVRTDSSGTVNNGQSTAIGYDPAGNRCVYSVSNSGAASATCGGGGGGGGGGGNQPPTTVNDTLSLQSCTSAEKNVVANDSDPEGNYPLELVSVSGGATKGISTIVSPTTIEFQSIGPTGTANVTYTVRDSLGATSTGTLTVNVTAGGTCM